jgi:hypothetical protein
MDGYPLLESEVVFMEQLDLILILLIVVSIKDLILFLPI